jgi:chaperonin GroES
MNTSGVRPLDNRVLVKPDNVETVTKGGIILIDTEKEQMAQVRGTLIAAGVNAWAEAAATSPEFVMPSPGTRVLIAKYGGIQIDGDDGEKYRIMNDLDITAVLEG